MWSMKKNHNFLRYCYFTENSNANRAFRRLKKKNDHKNKTILLLYHMHTSIRFTVSTSTALSISSVVYFVRLNVIFGFYIHFFPDRMCVCVCKAIAIKI